MLIQKVLHLHKEEEKKNPNINHEYIISEKKDGWYVFVDYFPDRGFSYPVSSSYRFVPSMEKSIDLFRRLPKPINHCRFIMEAVIPGMDFYTMNGIFNRSVGDVNRDDVEFYFHDLITLVDGNPIPETALDRYKRLQQIEQEIKNISRFHLLPILGISKDKNVWMKHAEEVWENGGEGVVLKRVDAQYKPDRRDSSLMKIKLENSFDLLCVRMYKTIGEKGNENLNLDLKNKKGIIIPVRIGKFSDIAKFEKESPVGKVIKIKCMKQSKDGSYREPRYDCVRYDKTDKDID
jgi:ATP-dependent DNA ligase